MFPSFIDENNYTLYVQQRFDEMEAKINDLRDQIEAIKAEKNRLEKQIETESEVIFCLNLLDTCFSNASRHREKRSRGIDKFQEERNY